MALLAEGEEVVRIKGDPMTLTGIGYVGEAPDVVDIHRGSYPTLLRTELAGRMLTEL